LRCLAGGRREENERSLSRTSCQNDADSFKKREARLLAVVEMVMKNSDRRAQMKGHISWRQLLCEDWSNRIGGSRWEVNGRSGIDKH